jgi:tetratricopeptide (TPR) repeat protein
MRQAFSEVESLRDSEDAQIAAGVTRLEGLVLYAEGRYAEAAATLQDSQEVLATVHPRLDSFTWAFHLDVLAAAGDANGLEERLAARETLAAVERTPFIEALYLRFQGRLLGFRGDTAGAAEALETAAQLFAAHSIRFYEAATIVELGEACGRPVPAETRTFLERIGASPWVERADALERAVAV